MRRKIASILSMGLCVTMLAACAKKDKTLEFTGDGTSEPEYQICLNYISPSAYSNALDLSLEEGTYLSIIGKDSTSAYWKMVKKGVEQAASDINKELGYTGNKKVKVTFSGSTEGEDIDQQVNILDEELARYPACLGIATVDENACTVQFDLATENGIPIIALDSVSSYQGIQCTVKTNNTEAAVTAASKLSDEIDNQGEILIFAHDSISGSARERVSGFVSEIEQNHPEVSVVKVIYLDKLDDLRKEIAQELAGEEAGQEEAQEQEVTEPSADEAGGESVQAESSEEATYSDEELLGYYVEKHPNLQGIYATNIDATQFALESIRTLEGDTNLAVVGFDAGKAQLEAIESGEVRGLIVQNPFGMGYAAVIAAARSALQIGNEAVVDTGYLWVTAENLNEPTIQYMLYD
jgi:ribose transport system substrate-binding protein